MAGRHEEREVPVSKSMDLSLVVQASIAIILVVIGTFGIWHSLQSQSRSEALRNEQAERELQLTVVEICVTSAILSEPIDARSPEETTNIINACMAAAGDIPPISVPAAP